MSKRGKEKKDEYVKKKHEERVADKNVNKDPAKKQPITAAVINPLTFKPNSVSVQCPRCSAYLNSSCMVCHFCGQEWE